MRRTLHLPEEGQTWRGLLFDVASPAVPGLRVETAAERRFRITQDGETVLWCRIRSDWYGVDIQHDRALLQVIEPLRADVARRLAEDDPATWYERWTHRFVDLLTDTRRGPLHKGRWAVRPVGDLSDVPAPALVSLDGMSPLWTGLDPGLIGEGVGRLDWDPPTEGAPILPLRPLSRPSTGRVKAYRKLVHDKTLPPVVLWFVGGLAGHVIIDGHDRLVAATEEGYFPPMLSFSRVLPIEEARDRVGWNDLDEMARLERVMQKQPDHHAAHEAVARQVVRASAHLEELTKTVAWPSTVPSEQWPAGLA